MPRQPLANLSPDLELQGKVTRIELYGAFVDVGAEKDGLVHISMLRKGDVKRVEDVVEVGQQVTVWVHRVDPEGSRLELSMVQPLALKWKDIKPGLSLKGKVVRLESFGAFVDLGAERPGLVHISEMSTEYVRSPQDVVSVGDEVEVRVLDVDRKKRQIKLSMKPEAEPMIEEEEEEEEPVPTAMEVALRQAMDGQASAANNNDDGQADGSGNAGKGRNEQEDLLARTLKSRVNTGNKRED